MRTPSAALTPLVDLPRIGSGPVSRAVDRVQRVQPKDFPRSGCWHRLSNVARTRLAWIGARLAGRMLRDGRATSAAADGASERVIIRRRRIRGAYSGVVMNWRRSGTARFTWTSAWWRAARATPRPGPRGGLRSETLAMSALDEARARGEARLDGLERRHDSRRSLCWPRHTRQHGARQAGQ